MGRDIQSWLHQQESHGQYFNAESFKLPFDLGMQNTSIPFAVPRTDAAPPNHALPTFGYSGLPNLKPVQLKEPHGWAYGLPHLRQVVKPNPTLHEKLLPNISLPGKVLTSVNENCGEVNTPIPTIGCVPKQFLVFDQTGNKTTMMFSSGVGNATQRLSSWSPKSSLHWNPHEGELGNGTDGHCNSGPVLTDEFNDDHVTCEESEMREDTEEIDALLYSDDEGNYSDDTEETSTGHSPSSMTAHEKRDCFNTEDTDEVASSGGPPVKWQKLSESSSEVRSVAKAASSVNPNRSLECEDAESSCAAGRPMGSLSGNKRLRNEKIRETVSILQTIIPSGKGKDAVMVLEEAVKYLRTLKFKAKSLGLVGEGIVLDLKNFNN